MVEQALSLRAVFLQMLQAREAKSAFLAAMLRVIQDESQRRSG
jgi:hypothetical protein